ncbi:MAG: mRNA interferase RelE/StbE [Clostridiales bacterium]|nr:mRNA interferase RelE/StbE [Clostridiales bacterium]
MMKIVFTKQASKFIKSQEPKIIERIMKAIDGLPFQGDIKSLKGEEGLKRLRVGDIRIIFREKGDELRIIKIGYRGDVYK